MKKRLLSASSLALCLVFSVFVQAQQEKKQLTLEQQVKVNVLKEQYVRDGVPYREAEQRATTVFENGQQISLRSRLAVPPTKSIQINRDPDNLTNPHPIYDIATAEDLVKKVLLSDPAAQSRITNVSFTGNISGVTRSLAYFENGNALGIEKGLILGTGNILDAEGGNALTGGLSNGTGITGDTHLGPIASPRSVNDVVILEFDFQPYVSKATFDFIFASEEYPNYSNSSYNDVFGFFVWEVTNPSSYINIALFPNGDPVTINNSNWGQISTSNNTPSGLPAPLPTAVNPQWHVPNYNDNYIGSDSIMEYNGRTIKLQAVADSLDTEKTYHLKLAIANVQDNSLGSAVFLANLDLGKAEGNIGGPTTGASVADVDALGLDENGDPLYLYGNRPCTYPMKLTFDNAAASTNAIIDINYITEAGTIFPKSALQNLEGKQLFAVDTIQLNGLQDTVMNFNFKVSTDFDKFVNGQYIGMTVSVRGSTTVDTVFYRQLFDTLAWDPVYRMVTDVDKGLLNLNVSGGTPYVHRSIDGGVNWKPVSDGFSQWDLLYIGEECDVLLYQPFQCCYDTIKIRKQSETVIVQRYINIPEVSGVMTVPGVGTHYVDSRKDFSFSAYYGGNPMSVKATGYYSRTTLELDASVEMQADGSYKYTIRQVVEPWTISFEPKTNSGDVSNGAFTVQPVWSSGNTLYINAQDKSVANIYTLTGVLYKQVEVGGNSSIRLPRGFYIVSLDGTQYKVMIK